MTERVDIGDWCTLYHADALDVVGDLGEFDYVLTDPPYPTGGESSMRSAKSIVDVRSMVDGMSQSLIMGVLRRVRKRRPFAIWLFVDWRQVSFFAQLLRGMGLAQQSCVVWDKQTGSLSPRYHPSHELVLFATNGVKPLGYAGKDIISCKRVKVADKTHAFEKPSALVTALCGAFPPGRALDPFCGTGGLLLGAKTLGWNAVGIDVGREFCETAKERLSGDGPLFEEPAPAQQMEAFT